MKTVKAVKPYVQEGGINFKQKPWETFTSMIRDKGMVVSDYSSDYQLPRLLHWFAYHIHLPRLFKNENEARLRFCQPYSLWFDTFPDYATYEVIPMLWDCWPEYWNHIYDWFDKCKPKSAIFTSSQVAEVIRLKYPQMNILTVTEGIDVDSYKKGKLLQDREIDFLQYGRHIDHIVNYDRTGINYVDGKKGVNDLVFTQDELYNAIANAKVVAAFPMSITMAWRAQGIETLTQRYWECMLSRCVMIGHAPKELTDLLGYNPVIELDQSNPDKQLRDVLDNIENYQTLVDKNREMALKYGDWRYSMIKVRDFLINCGYQI